MYKNPSTSYVSGEAAEPSGALSPYPYYEPPPPPSAVYSTERAPPSHATAHAYARTTGAKDDDGWGVFIGGFICLCFVLLLIFALSYPMSAYAYPEAYEHHEGDWRNPFVSYYTRTAYPAHGR